MGYRETVGAISVPTLAKIPSMQPLKPLAEQFRLGHAPWFPKPAGIIEKGAHRASLWMFLSTAGRHRQHRRPQGKPQPSPCHRYRQAARSMGLVLVGVTTDTSRTTVAIGRPGIA